MSEKQPSYVLVGLAAPFEGKQFPLPTGADITVGRGRNLHHRP